MKNLLTKGFEKLVTYAKNNSTAHVLAVTGAWGWALSCAAYTGAIALNKEIPSEQKKFLIPHELADGAINVSLFWLLTSRAKKFGEGLIESGKVLPEKIEKEVGEIKAKLGKDALFKEVEKHLSKESLEKLDHFKGSFPVLVSITGSVIAANIVTPMVRNIVAAKFQKKSINKSSIQEKPADTQQQRPTNIVKPLSVSSYSAASRGQMKI